MSLRDKGKFGFLYVLSLQSADKLTREDWGNIQNWNYQSHQGANYLILASGMYFNRVAELSEVIVALWTMEVLKDRDSELGTRTWEDLVPLLEAERMDFKYMIGSTQKIALQCAVALNVRIDEMKALIERKGIKLFEHECCFMESTMPTPQSAMIMLDSLERYVQRLDMINRDLSHHEYRSSLQHVAALVHMEDSRKTLNPRTLADAAS